MHGRKQKKAERSINSSGRELRRSSSSGARHMRSVLPSTTTRTVSAVTSDSFSKDGRKINVGDCALFKPPQDTPPFIGIIRWLAFSQENNLILGVNWLYRPSELKFGKGILQDAAPNEVFYSFHKDEIPAATLLHPCKVAFLPKGVELPSGISAFVCRRVYDVEENRLWWLTDKDFLDERQEEVDQLLQKTRVEMHATVQSGGRSPKPANCPMSSSQLKPGSDNAQSGGTPYPSQVKGKKRERGEQGPDVVKRERSLKVNDSDSGQSKSESILKSEIAKITEKGGLVDSEGVEKLVQLMHPERLEKKMDLVSRSMLVGVIAATDKFECLDLFVQLRGLPVLDEWLQDVHKGKIGDSSNTKESEKFVEEFILVLLRALDKLPVNLHALQMCHIGRSVNHLRSHKNPEIQKKVRSLVDTWKKRVEAEMNIIDAKSGSQAVSWPSKSRPEGSYGGSRNPNGSSDITVKNSVTQVSANKTSSIKSPQGEASTKSASSSPGPVKSPASIKEGGGTSDVPSARGEDKSSSSSQSHNNSQTLLGKEDAKGGAAGSTTVNKVSGGSSRNRKSLNGFPGGQKETSSSRNSPMHKISASEKVSRAGLTSDKPSDGTNVEGSIQKLIVKIPNRGRSPAQSISGGPSEDQSIMSSRASSPVLPEKHDQVDHDSKEKAVTSDGKTESWQSDDLKDVLTGSDEGDGLSAALADDVRSRSMEDASKLAEVSKAASSLSGNEMRSGKLQEGTFSSMNALIESCVKYSEANTSMSGGDDAGMNLLASVATGEISKSGMGSPTHSSQQDASLVDDMRSADSAKSKLSPGGNVVGDRRLQNGDADVDESKQVAAFHSSSDDRLCPSNHTPIELAEEKKAVPLSSERISAGESERPLDSKNMDFKMAADVKGHTPLSPEIVSEKAGDDALSRQLSAEENAVPSNLTGDGISDAKQGGNGSLIVEGKVRDLLPHTEGRKEMVEISASIPLQQGDCITNENTDTDSKLCIEQKPHSVVKSEAGGQTRVSDDSLILEKVHDFNSVKAAEIDTSSTVSQAKKHGFDLEANSVPVDGRSVVGQASTTVETIKFSESNCDKKDRAESQSAGSPNQSELQAVSVKETVKSEEKRESKLADIDTEDEKSSSTVAESSTVSATAAPVLESKIKFDLNEGFVTEDIKTGDVTNLPAPVSSSTVHMLNPLPFAVSSISGGVPAAITVAAAAKGRFVPPEDLLRSKGELGWKGSAATSAFRPAEPRKVLEMSLSSSSVAHADTCTSKHSRPPLDIDLNVPDERAFDDIVCRDSALETVSSQVNKFATSRNDMPGSSSGRSSGGLDLDLNRADDENDVGLYTASSSGRVEAPAIPIKPLSGGSCASEGRRDFDLNNGPGIDDANGDQTTFNQHPRGTMFSQPSVLRMNQQEVGNFSSWFPPGNTFSTVTIPSVLPERGEQPFPLISPAQRILGPAGGTPFTPDVYRGPVLSSSPAVPFPSSPFQYPVFPFGTTFPLPSATFSVGSTSYMDSSSGGRVVTPVNSQFLGPVGAVSSQYPRQYMVGLPDGSSNSGAENSRRWGRQGLDLNAGPGALDMEGRDDSLPLGSRQLSIASSQALAEEQARMYAVGGGVLKRKEPEGGWDASDGFRCKQSSWQ